MVSVLSRIGLITHENGISQRLLPSPTQTTKMKIRLVKTGRYLKWKHAFL